MATKAAPRGAARKAAPVKKAAVKKAAVKKVAKKAAPAKKAAVKKVVAKKAVVKKVAKKAAPTKKAAPVKKAAVKKVVAKKAVPVKEAAPAPKAAATPKAAPAPKAAAAPPAAPPAASATAPAAARKQPKSPPVSPRLAKVLPAKRKLVVREDESPWTAQELKAVRGELLADRQRLLAEITIAEEGLADLIRDSGDGAGDDQADAGSKTFEREHEMSLANNARDMLDQTEHALRRIDERTYGICESCGKAVGKHRLQAFPRATLCLACKQAEERF